MTTRTDLARELFHGTGVELGVANGFFSREILYRSDCERLYSIDRWTEAHHPLMECLQASLLLAHVMVDIQCDVLRGAAYNRFGGPVRPVESIILRASFEEAAALFPEGGLGFVYVDGYAHTGQEGGKTLEDWWPKIKPGGVMAGHDYDPLFQPTIDAVDAFVARHGLELHLTEEEKLRSWWVVKAG